MPGPYELYLIRHGVAEDRGEKWPDDTKRPLTALFVSNDHGPARAQPPVTVHQLNVVALQVFLNGGCHLGHDVPHAGAQPVHAWAPQRT